MIQTLHIVPEYNEELIYPAICKSMEALHIATDLRPEMKIVIKPIIAFCECLHSDRIAILYGEVTT